MAHLRLDNPFWTFSLKVYAIDGVAAECLAVQDANGVDVNLLLFAAWLGALHHRSLTEGDIGAMRCAAAGWHDRVVRPLRKIRQDVKVAEQMQFDAVQTLRKDIAAVELKAEQVEQALLFSWAEQKLDSLALSGDATRANVKSLLRAYGSNAEAATVIDAAERIASS
jgi:uncharacterized protein (TIGR02444 family)